MSALQTAYNVIAGLFGQQPSASAGAEVAVTVYGDKITVAELIKGLTSLKAFNWQQAITAIETAHVDPSAVLIDMEAVAEILAEVGVPFAGDVDLALKVASFLLLAGRQAGLKIEGGYRPLDNEARGR
jgi:hypothetical protein